MEYGKPLPKVNGDNRPFWEGCKDHVMKFQQCSACGHVRWPAAPVCPGCLSGDFQWKEASGRGEVYSHATYHVAYHPGFANELPYTVAVVRLDEGPLLLTNITYCEPQNVRCGMRVTVDWHDATPETTLPKFRPED